MADVIEFKGSDKQGPESEVVHEWLCQCGSHEFRLWNNGHIVCADCETVSSNLRCINMDD